MAKGQRIKGRTDIELQRLHLDEYVQRRLSELADREALQSAIRQWWKDVLPSMKGALEGLSESDVSYLFSNEVGRGLPRPSRAILNAGVQISLELAIAIDWILGLASNELRISNDDIPVAWCVLCEVTAPMVAREKDILVLQLFYLMCANRNQDMFLFDRAFVAACAESELGEYWIAEFSKPMNLGALSDGWTTNPSPEHYEDLLVEWKSNNNPFIVLTGSMRDGLLEGFPFVRLEYLRELDAEAWLNAVESLPLPEIQFQALGCFHDEPDNLIEAFKTVEVVLNPQGDWTRKTAAIHLIRIAEELLEGIYQSELQAIRASHDTFPEPAEASKSSSLQELVDGDISDWLRRMLEVLVVREDGPILTLEWSAHLFVKYLRLLDDNRWQEMLPLTERLLDYSIAALVSSGISVEQVLVQGQKHIKWEAELGRYGCAFRAQWLHFVLVAIQIIDGIEVESRKVSQGFDNQPLPIINPRFRGLWNQIVEVLGGGDPTSSLLINVSHPRGQQVACYQLGRVLASLEEPDVALVKAWRLLHRQRRESVERRHDNSEAEGAPKLLILAGLGAVTAIIDSKEPPPRDKMEGLWNVILLSMQSMVLMQVIDTQMTWKSIYSYAVALLGIQFRSGDPILDRAVAFISNDSKWSESTRKMLVANGWDPSAISDLFARNANRAQAVT